jgi:hypothetical protein
MAGTHDSVVASYRIDAISSASSRCYREGARTSWSCGASAGPQWRAVYCPFRIELLVKGDRDAALGVKVLVGPLLGGGAEDGENKGDDNENQGQGPCENRKETHCD